MKRENKRMKKKREKKRTGPVILFIYWIPETNALK